MMAFQVGKKAIYIVNWHIQAPDRGINCPVDCVITQAPNAFFSSSRLVLLNRKFGD